MPRLAERINATTGRFSIPMSSMRLVVFSLKLYLFVVPRVFEYRAIDGDGAVNKVVVEHRD
jgi:hypothetical protein